MQVKETRIKGVYIVEPDVFEDERGYFFESYNQKRFKESGIDIDFVQDNQSKSQYGVIRGLHYQADPWAQSKLVRVLEGKILDVVVDLRQSSPTFGDWVGVELSADNRKQLLLPRGFAHGFSVFSKTAVVMYKCDQFYHKEAERGIAWNDPELKIDWKISTGEEIVSEKDQNLPLFSGAEYLFE